MHGTLRDDADLERHLIEVGRGQSEGVADECNIDIVRVERPCGGEVVCRE
jgi:hypothetical protein